MNRKKLIETVNRLVDKLSNFLSPVQNDLEEKSKRILSGLMVIFTAPVLLTFGGIHILRADYFLGIFLLIAGSGLAVSITVLRRFKSVTVFTRLNLCFVGLLFLYLLAESGPYGYMAHWLYVYPLVTFFLLGRIEGLYYNIAFFLAAVIFLLFQDYLSWTTTHEIGFKARFIVTLFLICMLAYTFEFVRKKFQDGMMQNQIKLEDEKKRLAKAKREAEKASDSKSDFLANMSHELRTPLNHIVGFTELLLSKNFGDLNNTQEDYLNDVHNSSHHLLSLINDILDLSKVEAGKLEFEPCEFNLKTLLENSLSIIKEKALKHSIQLQIDLNAIPDTITADERKLKQIMYNLLSNAMKFTPDGGRVSVKATAYNINHTISLGENKTTRSGIKISVSDTGIGLRPEYFVPIFKSFEQVENKASRKYQGTGLGLSLTKKLVELHDGKIGVESEGEGKGSIFYFVIPTTPESILSKSASE